MIHDKLSLGGVAIVEALFLQKRPILVIDSHENPADFPNERGDVVRDKTTNFPGSADKGMGFARIYSIETMIDRLTSNFGSEFDVVVFEAFGENKTPDLDRYYYKREALNVPLRLLAVRRNS